MLKIIGERESIVEIVFDEYIPFSIHFEKQHFPTPLYWRAVPNSRNLLEVGIERTNGALVSFTLTLMSPNNVSYEDVMEKGETTIGNIQHIPVCDISPWHKANFSYKFKDDFIDERQDLHLFVGKDQLKLFIGIEREPISFISGPQVLFGLNEHGELTCIELIKLNDEQIGNLRATLKS